MKNRLLLPVFVSVFALLSFASCSKSQEDSSDGVSTLSIRMTDAPGNFDEVNVDIQGVEVKGPAGGAVSLNVNAGIYNLLNFVNGLDTLIASGSIQSGTITQIRLILGSNNSVKVNGQVYPLSTPSAQQSGLKLLVNQTLVPGVSYMLLLDFDAQQSIVEQGNGQYSLKPVIRVVSTIGLNGSITGSIVPPSVITALSAVDSGGNAFGTFSDTTGSFLIQGIPAGNYTLFVNPPAPYQADTLFNVAVVNGQMTDVGQVLLQ
jgi:hypothetical protein